MVIPIGRHNNVAAEAAADAPPRNGDPSSGDGVAASRSVAEGSGAAWPAIESQLGLPRAQR